MLTSARIRGTYGCSSEPLFFLLSNAHIFPFRCWISTNDVINDLFDCCTKRLEVCYHILSSTGFVKLFCFIFQSSSYNTRQWYEGEPVKCTFKSLENAKWLPGHKPSDAAMRKFEYSNRKMRFTVMKVHSGKLIFSFFRGRGVFL